MHTHLHDRLELSGECTQEFERVLIVPRARKCRDKVDMRVRALCAVVVPRMNHRTVVDEGRGRTRWISDGVWSSRRVNTTLTPLIFPPPRRGDKPAPGPARS